MKMSVEKLKQVNTVFTFVFFILISLFIAGSLVYAAVDFLGNLGTSHDRGVDIIENIDTEAEESAYSTEFVSAVKDVYVFAKNGGAVSLGINKAAFIRITLLRMKFLTFILCRKPRSKVKHCLIGMH